MCDQIKQKRKHYTTVFMAQVILLMFLQDEIYGQCLIGTYSFQTVFNVKFIKCICLAFTDSNPEYHHISMHVLHFEKPFLAA